MAPRYDKDDVIAAARAYGCVRLLEELGIPADYLDGQHHPCPKCPPGDGSSNKDRFRLLDADTGGVFCNQCFNKKNGDIIAAVRWFLGLEFWPAVAWIAERVGVQPLAEGKRKKIVDPNETLAFEEWSPELGAIWCLQNKPIAEPALVAVGARQAVYKFTGRSVIALPVRRFKSGQEWETVGYTLYDTTGVPMNWSKAKAGQEEAKSAKLAPGSKTGWMGQTDKLATADVVWICEGGTDMLALISAGLPPGHAVISSSSGAGDNLTAEQLRAIADKSIVIVYDADPPGEAGVEKKSGPLKGVGRDFRNAKLPYPVHEPVRIVQPDGTIAKRKKDVRDFLLERNGSGVADLLALAEAAPRHVRETPEPVLPAAEILESDDDPHRLARVLLSESDVLGGPVKHWREDWYVWQEGAWRRRSDSEFRPRVNLAIKKEFDRLHVEELSKKDDVQPVKKVVMSLVSNVMQAMAGMVGLADSIEWNTWLPETKDGARPWVAMANGILKIDRLMEGDDADELDDVLIEHTPDWWSPICLPYAFDPDAECPRWEKFLDRNLESDQERIAIIQEFLGHLLIPKTDLTKFLLLEGEGANGKSVICGVAEALVGQENASHVPLESFGERFALTTTLGKLVNICAEIGDADKVAEAKLKAFTGGDAMSFDRKGKQPVEALPTARCIFATNVRPRFCDRSNGLWRRILLIPMNVQVGESERVAGMDRASWWVAQHEMPGIFRWSLAGLYRLLQNGKFSKSTVTEEALEEYRGESNPTLAFLKEECEAAPPAHSAYSNPIKAADLYKSYADWSERQGNRPLSAKFFGKEIRKVFPAVERKRLAHGKREWVYFGVRLIGDDAAF